MTSSVFCVVCAQFAKFPFRATCCNHYLCAECGLKQLLSCFYRCGVTDYRLERAFDTESATHMSEKQREAVRHICDYYDDASCAPRSLTIIPRQGVRGRRAVVATNETYAFATSDEDPRAVILEKASSAKVHQSTLKALLERHSYLMEDYEFMAELARLRPESVCFVRDDELAVSLAKESLQHHPSNFDGLPLNIRQNEQICAMASRLPCGCRPSNRSGAKHTKKCPIWPNLPMTF